METRRVPALVVLVLALILGIVLWSGGLDDARVARGRGVAGAGAGSERPPAAVELEVSGNSPRERRVEFAPAPPSSQDEGATEDQDSGLLRVTVLDPNGRPAAGVAARVVRREATGTRFLDLTYQEHTRTIAEAVTGAAGTVEFRLPRGRSYELWLPADAPADRVQHRLRCRADLDLMVELGPAATIEGRVTWAADGRAIADATVGFWGKPGTGFRRAEAVRTDARGDYRLEGVPPGRSTLLVRVEGQPLGASPWLEPGPGDRLRQDFFLEPPVTLRGRVEDRLRRRPIEGASVADNHLGEGAVRTDAEGRFVLQGWERRDRTVVLFVHAAGFARGQVVVEPPPPGREEAEIVVRLREGAALSGRVVDAAGTPVRGAFLHLYGSSRAGTTPRHDLLSAWSGADGSFTFEQVRKDVAHGLAVRRDGYGTLLLALRQTLRDVELGDLVLAPEARIQGRVLTPAGTPAVEATVELKGSSLVDRELALVLDTQEATVDAGGVFVFSGLAAGTYELRAKLRGRPEEVTSARTLVAGERAQDMVLSFGITGSALVGRVLLPSGAPAAGADVQLSGPRGTTLLQTRTGHDGGFRFDGLDDDVHGLRAFPPHSTPAPLIGTQRSDLRPGGPEVVLELGEGASIRGVGLTPDGEPAAGARAQAWIDGNPIAYDECDAGGAFQLIVPLGSIVDVTLKPARKEGRDATGRTMVFAVAADEDSTTPETIRLPAIPAGEQGLVLQL